MAVPKRLSTCVILCGLSLAFAAVTAAETHAQVLTYPDANSAETTDAILPEGVTWNHPLKAGDMVLPRAAKPVERPKTQTEITTKKPVSGALQAPVLGASVKAKPTAPALAPQIDKGQGSTQSMMLLQGMKTALQQSGHNPELPKSTLEVDAAAQPAPELKPIAPIFASAPTPTALAEEKSEATASDSVVYVKGREPKSFGTAEVAPTAQVKSVSEDGEMEIVFPPEMSGEAQVVVKDQPKVEGVGEEPAPKAASAKGEGDKKKGGFWDRLTSPVSSIFGDPVEEDKEESKTTDSQQIKAPAQAAASKECQQSVTKWTRECADAGYPAHFVGQIVGETRVECPANEAKDVWLSNSCAAPIASSSYAVQGGTKATDISDMPSTLASAPVDPASLLDGACGASNGMALSSKPTADLCTQGTSSTVLGEGPWRWSCKGQKGGVTVSCASPAAPKAVTAKTNATKDSEDAQEAPELKIVDGKCGDAAGAGTSKMPAANLCENGLPSKVNGTGPWTWACSGSNGGTAAACTAPLRTNGICGLANKKATNSMPMRDLCTAGYASAVTGEGPWNWTCSGLHGGDAVTCSANAAVNAICGAATTKGHAAAPEDDLCGAGVASAVTGKGPWNWTCKGEFGGAAVSCQASALMDGLCGPAHGNAFSKAPSDDLCSHGKASRVTGMGPWNWTCAGDMGGVTVSCTASLGGSKDSAPRDEINVAEDVQPTPMASKSSASGLCGSAVAVKAAVAPTTNLCASGTASDPVPFEKKAWRWECKGTSGSKEVCMAPLVSAAEAAAAASQAPTPKAAPSIPVKKDTLPNLTPSAETPVATALPEAMPEAICGKADGQGLDDKPSSDLCAVGKPGKVKGTGPWSWTCSAGKAEVTCEAQKKNNGACGNANGSIQSSTPTSGLCSSGSATAVTGTGPWLWSCVGTGGGSSSSCSASSQTMARIDGTCGVAANAVSTSAPVANLCDTGKPSAVHGDGPWTWTCSGSNGGIASTCSTSKVQPVAPPPPGPAVNGVCGYSNGVSAVNAPKDGLCASGTQTAMSGNGPWNWSCIGANGGMTVSCTAPLTPPSPIIGACGTANGVPSMTPPRSGLCSAGIASAVNGKGPWTWSCSGTNGGGAVSCVAPLAGQGASSQSIPSIVTPTLDAEAPAPQASPAGLVTPQLPTGPLPALKPGTLPQLKTSKKSGDEKVNLPRADLSDEGLAAPASAPALPDGMEELPGKPLSSTSSAADLASRVAPGTKLMLEPEVSTIAFAAGSEQLDKEAMEVAEKLARVLQVNREARITLVAYAGTDGVTTPRKARRISLNRALAIRDYMATKGVPNSRVDVRPMGANVPSGDMDRVDVKVN